MGNMTNTFFDNLDAAATWSAGVAFKRSKGLPLDKYSVFETKALAIEYAEKRGTYAETPVSYPGQVIAVAEGDKMVAYVLAENAEGTALELQQIGIIPTGDDKTISVTEDGEISLLAADVEVFKKDEEGNDTEEKVINAGAQLILQSDGTLKWVQPDTSTAEGQAAAISALQGRMTTAEGDIDKLEEADAALDIAVKAAQKAADDVTNAFNTFMTSEDVDQTVNTLKEIQAEIDKMTDATELATAIAGKADKVEGATEGNFAGLDAEGNLVDSGKKATDFATTGALADVDAKFASYTTTEALTGLLADKADSSALETGLADAKADTDTKLAGYYTKEEIAGLDYATNTALGTAVSTLEGSIATTDAKAQKGVDDAKTAKDAADAAQADANTNALNIQEVEKVLNGYTVGEGEGAQTVVGLRTQVATNTGDIADVKGTLVTHDGRITANATAAGNAQAQADEALRIANTKTTMGEVEAKGYAVAETVNAEIAKKTTMAEVEAKGYAVADTVNAELAKKADKETTYTKDEVNGLLSPFATTEDLDKVKATANAAAVKTDVDAKFEALDAVDLDYKTRIETMEAFWAAAEVDGTDKSVVDTLKEIQDYIKNDETGASNMLAAIEANEEAIAAEKLARENADAGFETRVAANEKAISETVPAAIEAVEKAAKDYTDEEIAKVDTGVMSVTSLHDAIIVETVDGAVTINFASEIILDGGGADTE